MSDAFTKVLEVVMFEKITTYVNHVCEHLPGVDASPMGFFVHQITATNVGIDVIRNPVSETMRMHPR